MADEIKKTERGFSEYGELTDSYQSKVSVQESSAVGPSQCWIFCTNDVDPNWDNPTPHLTADMAKQLIGLLQTFVEDAEDPKNWRNDPEYKADFWDED